MKYWFNSLLAILATAATYFWGGWDLPIIVLVCFMVADYISGVLLAITRRELSSSVGFKGLAKKAVMLVVIALAVQLDRLINDGDGIFRTLCAYFYIANEGISILENAAGLGIPVPAKLKKVLADLKRSADGGSDDEAEDSAVEADDWHVEKAFLPGADAAVTSDGDESDGDESDGGERDVDESDGDESDGDESDGDESDGGEAEAEAALPAAVDEADEAAPSYAADEAEAAAVRAESRR